MSVVMLFTLAGSFAFGVSEDINNYHVSSHDCRKNADIVERSRETAYRPVRLLHMVAPVAIVVREENSDGTYTVIYETTIPLQPSMNVIAAIRTGYRAYRGAATNPFDFNIRRLHQDCYVLSKDGGGYQRSNYGWTINMRNFANKVVYDRQCVPDIRGTSTHAIFAAYKITITYQRLGGNVQL